MRIYSMTATFGKLENKTLTVQPGLNIIQAPNEWGKSTWCAFLTAMLYGIETRAHTTKTVLADKERYAPWSGSPMSGRIDLNWNGRDITIERSSKGRSVFGQFRAYETHTGLEIPELTGANCGQMLLGVEKSVFTRAGFIRLTELPVTQDDALRRRLNAIVTTGDESGTADTLAQKLRDLKNRCRANRSTGLLPQAEAQQRELLDSLSEWRQLREQSDGIHARLDQLHQHQLNLENHLTALDHAEAQAGSQRLSAARTAWESAGLRETQLQEICSALPSRDQVERTLIRLRQLRDNRDSLQLEAQMLLTQPQKPEAPAPFRGLDPEAALSRAEHDEAVYAKNAAGRSFPWYWIALMVLGAAGLLIPHWAGIAAGALLIAAGAVFVSVFLAAEHRRKAAIRTFIEQYAPLRPDQWTAAAQQYAREQAEYSARLQEYQAERAQLESRATALRQQITALAAGRSLSELEGFYSTAQKHWDDLAAATREKTRAEEFLRALRASCKEAAPPAFPDTMTYTRQETARLLSDCEYEQRQLQRKLGHTQGRMEALGQEAALQQQLEAVNQRIQALENTYAALELAQSTLASASAELQRRFAPRISQRAQTLFGKLTGGRYTRLTLAEDLTLHAAAGTETTLHSALWRSEGTIDQLYLALRLAVAEALTPEAPLVLDDALVRFDDDRLSAALAVLAEEAEARQVILFTCQNREARLSARQKGENP